MPQGRPPASARWVVGWVLIFCVGLGLLGVFGFWLFELAVLLFVVLVLVLVLVRALSNLYFKN